MLLAFLALSPWLFVILMLSSNSTCNIVQKICDLVPCFQFCSYYAPWKWKYRCRWVPQVEDKTWLEKFRRLLRTIGSAILNKVLFTDECSSTLDRSRIVKFVASYSRKVSRRLLLQKQLVAAIFRPPMVVRAGICPTGKIPLVFIEWNVKMNTTTYQRESSKTYWNRGLRRTSEKMVSYFRRIGYRLIPPIAICEKLLEQGDLAGQLIRLEYTFWYGPSWNKKCQVHAALQWNNWKWL